MGPEIVFVAIVAYIGFMQWLRHQRRAMVHRERLAAIEKGASLPADAELQRGFLAALAWPPETGAGGDEERRKWNVQRLLLLAGLVWLSIGISAYVVLSAVLAANSPAAAGRPPGHRVDRPGPGDDRLSHLIVLRRGPKPGEVTARHHTGPRSSSATA